MICYVKKIPNLVCINFMLNNNKGTDKTDWFFKILTNKTHTY